MFLYIGYIKCQLVSIYCVQCCGGKGCLVLVLKDEDVVEQLWVVNIYDMLLIFFSIGCVYWFKVYQMFEVGLVVCGKLIVNLLLLVEGEKVQVVLLVCEYVEDCFVFFVICNGMVKKILLIEFVFQLQKGKQVINFVEGDVLVNVVFIDGNSDVLLFVFNGKVNCFDENIVCLMGCIVIGVCGMCLVDDVEVVLMIVVFEGDVFIVIVCGYGKCIVLDEFLKKGCGIQGVIGIQCFECNGVLVVVVQVIEVYELMLIFNQGILVCICVVEVFQFSCNIQGVILIKLLVDEVLVSVVWLEVDEDNGEEVEVLVFEGQFLQVDVGMVLVGDEV